MVHESVEFTDTSSCEVALHGFMHHPLAANGEGIVLTHGAGSNCEAPLLISLANAFCELGLTVLRCDLAFRQRRPKGPPPRGSAERDQEALQRALIKLRQTAPGKLFLGGHSYGGRQASMLAAAQPELVDALLLLSYPLHPPKKPEQVRVAHLPILATPALFVQGTRDGFATAGELRTAIKLIPARTEFVSLQGAGHELVSARNRDEICRRIAREFVEFKDKETPACEGGSSPVRPRP